MIKMKINKVILACAVFALAGCQEDDLFDGKRGTVNAGDAISFGGSLTYKTTRTNLTRTVYGDKGTEGTEIKWYEGDSVRIYCAEASVGDGQTTVENVKYCDYGVTTYIEKPVYNDAGTITNPTTSNPKGDGTHDVHHESGLAVSENAPCLRWGDANVSHNFYGVYPTAGQLKAAGDDVAANALNLTGSTLKAYLPNTQAPVRYMKASAISTKDYDGTDKEGKHYIIHPSMRNAYMVATAKNIMPSAGSVDLIFRPIVTAVEMTLVNNSTFTDASGVTVGQKMTDISLVNLTAIKPICGSFQADVESRTITSLNPEDLSYFTVGIPVKDENGDHITLEYGDKITFTAFLLLPGGTNDEDGLESISVSIVTGGTSKNATLSGNGVKIVQAQKKNFIANVPINIQNVQTVEISSWMASLNSTTKLSGLSIPGAGGATSSTLTGNPYSQEQVLSISELWERGIRCFEFAVDLGTVGNNPSYANVGNLVVYCNGLSTGVKLKDAIDDVAEKIASTTDDSGNPTEFGVVIITYSENDLTSYTRNGQYSARAITNFWNGYSYEGVDKNLLFDINKTIDDVRGHLFCIGRPVAIGLDPGWYTGINTSNQYVLTVLGWGNNPDQWYARGFGDLTIDERETVSGSDAVFDSDNYQSANVTSRPYYLSEESYPTPATTSVTSGIESNFMYKLVSTAPTSNDGTYNSAKSEGWIQEWRRVVPTESTRAYYGISALPTEKTTVQVGSGTAYEYYYSWAPSEDEKWADIESTLNLAVSNKHSYDLIINSLCGFFVDGSIPHSYYPNPTFQRAWKWFYYKYEDWQVLDDKYNHSAFNTSSGSSPNTNNFGPYHPAGGFQGNIAAYADWVNNKFYNLLLTKLANGTLNGPTGIVMMDRVSDTADDPAGYYIPQIIISNNFAATTSDISIEYSTFEAGDTRTLQVAE